MPVVFEVTLLALLAYAIGLAIGWALWSRDTINAEGEKE